MKWLDAIELSTLSAGAVLINIQTILSIVLLSISVIAGIVNFICNIRSAFREGNKNNSENKLKEIQSNSEEINRLIGELKEAIKQYEDDNRRN